MARLALRTFSTSGGNAPNTENTSLVRSTHAQDAVGGAMVFIRYNTAGLVSVLVSGAIIFSLGFLLLNVFHYSDNWLLALLWAFLASLIGLLFDKLTHGAGEAFFGVNLIYWPFILQFFFVCGWMLQVATHTNIDHRVYAADFLAGLVCIGLTIGTGMVLNKPRRVQASKQASEPPPPPPEYRPFE